MKKQVFDEMNIVLEERKKTYNEKYIFGIFYTKDKNILTIIIPTLDNIINNNQAIDNIEIKDIRKVDFSIIEQDIWIINPRYEYLFFSIKDGQALKEKIIKRLIENNDVIKFIKQLNDMDKTILEAILAEIGLEGTISLHKISVRTNAAKLAVTNLISKLNNSGLAEVTYYGNQGTHIKILDDILVDIRGRYSKV